MMLEIVDIAEKFVMAATSFHNVYFVSPLNVTSQTCEYRQGINIKPNLRIKTKYKYQAKLANTSKI